MGYRRRHPGMAQVSGKPAWRRRLVTGIQPGRTQTRSLSGGFRTADTSPPRSTRDLPAPLQAVEAECPRSFTARRAQRISPSTRRRRAARSMGRSAWLAASGDAHVTSTHKRSPKFFGCGERLHGSPTHASAPTSNPAIARTALQFNGVPRTLLDAHQARAGRRAQARREVHDQQ
jgi:hypothetical protein